MQDDTVTVQGGNELFQTSHYALSQGMLQFGRPHEIDGEWIPLDLSRLGNSGYHHKSGHEQAK